MLARSATNARRSCGVRRLALLESGLELAVRVDLEWSELVAIPNKRLRPPEAPSSLA